tara:strand:- start:618 stop:929 length:312 start_codon:yes stop_codon:yes gene_type:complete
VTNLSAKNGSEEFKPLPQAAAESPVFSLNVHVCRTGEGVEAQAANLPGFSCCAADERTALQKLLAAVKNHVAGCLARGEVIEWIDPPKEPEDGMQHRVIPFHL